LFWFAHNKLSDTFLLRWRQLFAIDDHIKETFVALRIEILQRDRRFLLVVGAKDF